MEILMIGDIVGKIGRKALTKELAKTRKKHNIDLIIANVENLAHGSGITEKTINEVKEAGVDFCTSGNHIWRKSEGLTILDRKDTPVLRPANYPPGLPGIGEKVLSIGIKQVLVINLMGRLFMKATPDCPFRALDEILKKHARKKLDAILVDFHAETTSEKKAFGFYADGRVSAVVGTHTHVPTADEQILPKGTGYVTDLGMTGAKNSVLGYEIDSGIKTQLLQIPPKPEIPEAGTAIINSVLISTNPTSIQTTKIKRIDIEVEV